MLLYTVIVLMALISGVQASVCVVSFWTEWNNCVGNCQFALRVRNRNVIRPPFPERTSDGRLAIRPCPALYRVQTCIPTVCLLPIETASDFFNKSRGREELKKVGRTNESEIRRELGRDPGNQEQLDGKHSQFDEIFPHLSHNILNLNENLSDLHGKLPNLSESIPELGENHPQLGKTFRRNENFAQNANIVNKTAKGTIILRTQGRDPKIPLDRELAILGKEKAVDKNEEELGDDESKNEEKLKNGEIDENEPEMNPKLNETKDWEKFGTSILDSNETIIVKNNEKQVGNELRELSELNETSKEDGTLNSPDGNSTNSKEKHEVAEISSESKESLSSSESNSKSEEEDSSMSSESDQGIGLGTNKGKMKIVGNSSPSKESAKSEETKVSEKFKIIGHVPRQRRKPNSNTHQVPVSKTTPKTWRFVPDHRRRGQSSKLIDEIREIEQKEENRETHLVLGATDRLVTKAEKVAQIPTLGNLSESSEEVQFKDYDNSPFLGDSVLNLQNRLRNKILSKGSKPCGVRYGNRRCCRLPLRNSCPNGSKVQPVLRWARSVNEDECGAYMYSYCGLKLEFEDAPIKFEQNCYDLCFTDDEKHTMDVFQGNNYSDRLKPKN